MFRVFFLNITHFLLKFQLEIIYANGASAPAELIKQLETISGHPESDRDYINSISFMFFSEKYLRKQVKKGLSREEVLAKLRDSKRYDIIKGLSRYYSHKISMCKIIYLFLFCRFVFVSCVSQWNRRRRLSIALN